RALVAAAVDARGRGSAEVHVHRLMGSPPKAIGATTPAARRRGPSDRGLPGRRRRASGACRRRKRGVGVAAPSFIRSFPLRPPQSALRPAWHIRTNHDQAVVLMGPIDAMPAASYLHSLNTAQRSAVEHGVVGKGANIAGPL